MEHYRCHKIWVKDTKNVRVGNTVFFKHKYLTMPTLTNADALVNAANDLKAALNGRRLDIIMECIGGKVLMDGFKELGVEGRMIIYGSASFTTPGDRPNKLSMLLKYLKRPKIDPLRLPNSNKSLMGFNLIWLYAQTEKFNRIFAGFFIF